MRYSAGNPLPLKKRVQDIKIEAGVSYEAGEIEAVKGGLGNKTDKIYMYGEKVSVKAVVDGYTPPPTPPTPTVEKWKANLKGYATDVSFDSTVTIKAVEPTEKTITFELVQNGGNTQQKLITPKGYQFRTNLNSGNFSDLTMIFVKYNFITDANGNVKIKFKDNLQAFLFENGKVVKASEISIVEKKADTPDVPPVQDESVPNLKGADTDVSYDSTVTIETTEPTKETITLSLKQNGNNAQQKLVTSSTPLTFATNINGSGASELKMIFVNYNFITDANGNLIIKFKNTLQAYLFNNGKIVKAKSIKIAKEEVTPTPPEPTPTTKTYADIDSSKKLFGSQIKQPAKFKITGITTAGLQAEQEFTISGSGNPNYNVTPNGFYWDGSAQPMKLLNTAYDFFIDDEGYFKLYANNTEFFIYVSKTKTADTKVKATGIENLSQASDENAENETEIV